MLLLMPGGPHARPDFFKPEILSISDAIRLMRDKHLWL